MENQLQLPVTEARAGLRPMHSQRRPELSRKIGLTKNEGDETSAIAWKECEMCIAFSCICINVLKHFNINQVIDLLESIGLFHT